MSYLTTFSSTFHVVLAPVDEYDIFHMCVHSCSTLYLPLSHSLSLFVCVRVCVCVCACVRVCACACACACVFVIL